MEKDISKPQMSFVEAASNASRIGNWIKALMKAEEVLTMAGQAEDAVNRLKREADGLTTLIEKLKKEAQEADQEMQAMKEKRRRDADMYMEQLDAEIQDMNKSLSETKLAAQTELGRINKELASARESRKEALEQMENEQREANSKLMGIRRELAALKEKL